MGDVGPSLGWGLAQLGCWRGPWLRRGSVVLWTPLLAGHESRRAPQPLRPQGIPGQKIVGTCLSSAPPFCLCWIRWLLRGCWNILALSGGSGGCVAAPCPKLHLLMPEQWAGRPCWRVLLGLPVCSTWKEPCPQFPKHPSLLLPQAKSTPGAATPLRFQGFCLAQWGPCLPPRVQSSKPFLATGHQPQCWGLPSAGAVGRARDAQAGGRG